MQLRGEKNLRTQAKGEIYSKIEVPGRKKNENATVPNRKENEQSKNDNKAIKGMRERTKKLRCQKTAANVHGTAMNRELNDGKYIEKSAKKARRKNRPSIAQNKKVPTSCSLC